MVKKESVPNHFNIVEVKVEELRVDPVVVPGALQLKLEGRLHFNQGRVVSPQVIIVKCDHHFDGDAPREGGPCIDSNPVIDLVEVKRVRLQVISVHC